MRRERTVSSPAPLHIAASMPSYSQLSSDDENVSPAPQRRGGGAAKKAGGRRPPTPGSATPDDDGSPGGGDPAAMVQQLMQALNASKAKKDTKGDKKIAERIEAEYHRKREAVFTELDAEITQLDEKLAADLSKAHAVGEPLVELEAPRRVLAVRPVRQPRLERLGDPLRERAQRHVVARRPVVAVVLRRAAQPAEGGAEPLAVHVEEVAHVRVRADRVAHEGERVALRARQHALLHHLGKGTRHVLAALLVRQPRLRDAQQQVRELGDSELLVRVVEVVDLRRADTLRVVLRAPRLVGRQVDAREDEVEVDRGEPLVRE